MAAMTPACGSVIIWIVSNGRDPKPAFKAASWVAFCAFGDQIAGIVNQNSIGVIPKNSA